MAKTINELVAEQLGGLTLQLCLKDAELALLREENVKLQNQISELQKRKD